MPSLTFKVREVFEGEHLSDILVHEFEHITKKGGMCGIKVSFSQARVGFMGQRCSETPHFVTTEWDIRCLSFHRR